MSEGVGEAFEARRRAWRDGCFRAGLDAVDPAGERPDAIPEAAIEAYLRGASGRAHRSVHERVRDGLTAALPFLRAAHPEAGSEEAERLLSVIGSTSCNCRSKAEDALRAAHPEAGSEEPELLRMQRDVARRNFRMLDERAAQLLDAVKTAVQELPLTRVDSKPSDFQDGPSRAGARLRLALRAAHPEADRAPTQRERDRALNDYMAEHGPNAQRRRRDAARREADRAPEKRAGQEEQWEQGSSGVGEADRAPEGPPSPDPDRATSLPETPSDVLDRAPEDER